MQSLLETGMPALAVKSRIHDEWYTPKEYVDAARSVMEGIDLDPASCEEANVTVRATRFYSVDENGLDQEWHGRLWMNPPYTRQLIGQFAEKLVNHYLNGTVSQ